MKARKLGVMAPAVYLVDLKARTIYMEHIVGTTMKDVLNAAEVNLAGDAALCKHWLSDGMRTLAFCTLQALVRDQRHGVLAMLVS